MEWKRVHTTNENEIDEVEEQIWPALAKCKICRQKRHEHFANNKFEHWQICKSHRKCVLRQHRLHEEGIDYEAAPLSPETQEIIEREDGSLERTLNSFAESRYMPLEREIDIEYIPEPPSHEFHVQPKSSKVSSLIASLCGNTSASLRSAVQGSSIE